jgi:glycosyltransferase involved in cell wall biosynthesis
MATVCLNMIVKDEAAIIERCLAAAAPHIDCWVILDTGSSDATPAIVESFFAERGIPGRLVHGRFDNFEQARNDALTAARATDLEFDWLLLADADMELRVDDPAWRSRLAGPACALVQRTGSFAYSNIRLVRRDHPARYVGVTHEYLDLGGAQPVQLSGIWYLDHAQGSSRTVKFGRDIDLLTKALAAEPSNSRYVFYLAQSYRDSGDLARAIEFYRQRAAMGGWDEEVWFSLFQIAVLSDRLDAGDAQVVPAYLAAWQFRPSRAEPLVALAAYHRRNGGRYHLADLFARRALEITRTSDKLFVEESAYGWAALDEAAVAAYWVGDHARSAELCRRLLGRSDVPAEHRERTAANLAHAQAALPSPRRTGRAGSRR